VLPLVNKDGMPEIAEQICRNLRRSIRVDYDTSGAIGRRYRRQDEVGTPFCITVDGQTSADQTVTLRERDSMQQERVSIDALEDIILRRIRR
jgi:glycyl-tRNA synthetase